MTLMDFPSDRARLKTVLNSLVILSVIGCISGYNPRTEAAGIAAITRISNDKLVLGICMRDAGAVCSLVYDGHEFVNDFDHGRQMQIAWFYNDLGEAYNPTEAGSVDDFTKPSTTSVLLSVRVDGATLVTESHPAYWEWERPGKHLNVQAVTKDTLKKTITLGYLGDPHVIVIDAAVTVSPELTGPPVKKIRVEAPAFYMSRALTEHYSFDLRNGAMVKIPPPPPTEKKGAMNVRMGLNTDRKLMPILSSPDGRYAVGMYTAQAENFWTYSSYSIPHADPTNACNKATTRFVHAAEAGHIYTYRTFVIIGDLTTVKKSAVKLP
jgi:hypothetical protein